MWICPTCKSPDHLEVTVEVWDANSVMMCVNPECATSYDTHIAEYFEIDTTDPEPKGDDLCDTCHQSGVEVDHTTDKGETVCTDCAEGAK